MHTIEIAKLINSLQEVEWNYNFKLIKHKDGSGTLSIPDFIMRDLNWAIEEGNPTPRSQVYAGSDYGENENAYWEWDVNGNQIGVIYGDYYFDGKKIAVTRNNDSDIVDFRYIEEEEN